MKNRSESNRRQSLNFAAWSVGYIVLGLVLLLAPDHGKQMLCYLIGGGIIVLGIGRIVWYFAKDDVSRAFHNDIPYGIVLLLMGVYLIARPDAVFGWLPVILGFAVVFDSMIKLQHAFDLKRTGFGPWGVVLVASIATAVLGVLLIIGMFKESVLLYFFGGVMLADGLLNLAIWLLLTWQLRRKKHPQKSEPPQEPRDTQP